MAVAVIVVADAMFLLQSCLQAIVVVIVGYANMVGDTFVLYLVVVVVANFVNVRLFLFQLVANFLIVRLLLFQVVANFLILRLFLF